MRRTRICSQILLLTGVFSWLSYLLIYSLPVTGSTLSFWLALLAGFALSVALVLWLDRSAQLALRHDWENLDRGNQAALYEFQKELDHAGALNGSSDQIWSSRLLERSAGQTGVLDCEQALNHLRLMQLGSQPQASWGRLLQLMPQDAELAFPILQQWNRLDAEGCDTDWQEVDQRLEQLGTQAIGRRHKKLLPLFLQRARKQAAGARNILLKLLNLRLLKPKDLPQDLLDLLESEALDPRVTAPPLLNRVAAALGRVSISTPAVHFRPGPVQLKALAGLATLCLLVFALSRITGNEGGNEEQAESLSSETWAIDTTSAGGFTIQVMASKDSLQAMVEVERLQSEGLWCYLLEPRPNSSWYRVRLGHFSTRVLADSVAADLKQQALIDAWYVANYERKDLESDE